ncbi:hypothetical protein D3C76_1469420 [compost metagenome]
MFARRTAVGRAADQRRLTVAVLEYVLGVGGTVVVTSAVFTWQAVDAWLPEQLYRQDRAFCAAAAELEAVGVFGVGRVLLVHPDLCEQLRGELVLDPQGPLGDWPVVPNAPPVADLRAAEGQVLEAAIEAVEVFTFAEATDLDV